jgi:hypothetical protein
MILIPTWDIVLGYPIYKFLCWKDAGVHIYKTLDNVEGFYVGVREKTPILLPYKGYKYIDYRERRSGKYYRNSWINNNTSKDCVSYIGAWNYDYTQAFRHGKCIVKKEIPEKEVSGLWKISKKIIKDYNIFYLKITSVFVEVIDPRTKEKYFTVKDYMVDESWITGALNMVTNDKDRYSCTGIAANTNNSIGYYTIVDYIIKTNKKGEK